MLCPQHMHYKFLVCGGISPSNLLLGLTWVVLLLLFLVPLVPLASLWHLAILVILAILVGPLLLQVRYQNQAPLLSPWAASGWELALRSHFLLHLLPLSHPHSHHCLHSRLLPLPHPHHHLPPHPLPDLLPHPH